jgi:hypothetical protein
MGWLGNIYSRQSEESILNHKTVASPVKKNFEGYN